MTHLITRSIGNQNLPVVRARATKFRKGRKHLTRLYQIEHTYSNAMKRRDGRGGKRKLVGPRVSLAIRTCRNERERVLWQNRWRLFFSNGGLCSPFIVVPSAQQG